MDVIWHKDESKYIYEIFTTEIVERLYHHLLELIIM